jgi:hypothetical protein
MAAPVAAAAGAAAKTAGKKFATQQALKRIGGGKGHGDDDKNEKGKNACFGCVAGCLALPAALLMIGFLGMMLLAGAFATILSGTAQACAASGAGVTNGTSVSVGPVGTISTAADFASAVLGALNDPTGAQNILAISAWSQAEDPWTTSEGTHNPLNTTQPESGSTSRNSDGVQGYPNWQEGVQATVSTLVNGHYSNILAALKAGTSAQAVASAVGSSPWGTSGSLISQIIGQGGGGGAGSPQGGGGSCSGAFGTGNGNTQAIEAAANQLAAMNVPYVYGGGHVDPAQPNPGVDCSSAVSWVLQHAGVKLNGGTVPTGDSGEMESWFESGQAGEAGVLLYASPDHVFMVVNGQLFSANAPGQPVGWKGAATVANISAQEPSEPYSIRHIQGTA